jgi:hypothetical protein
MEKTIISIIALLIGIVIVVGLLIKTKELKINNVLIYVFLLLI